jgi:hypothetical protein
MRRRANVPTNSARYFWLVLHAIGRRILSWELNLPARRRRAAGALARHGAARGNVPKRLKTGARCVAPMAASAPTGDRSGNYLGAIIALSVIVGICLVAAALWIHFHGY